MGAGLRMAGLPDPERSRVVLIGASRFTDPELPDLPAVRNNLDGLAACFQDPARWGLPEAHCRVVTDPDSAVALVDPIHQAAAEAEDTLLVYYAGHGLVHPRTLGLLLAVVGSSPGRTYTAVPYDEVRHHMIDSRATRKVVILDCCYSGRATGGMADPTNTVANEAVIEGTYLLASAPPNRQSLSPPGETYTAFTGALLTVLTEGLPNGPELLALNTIYRHVRDTLKHASRPEPQLRVDNTAGELALVRNAWPGPASTPPSPAEPAPAPPRPARADTEDRRAMLARRAEWAQQPGKAGPPAAKQTRQPDPARLTNEMVRAMYDASGRDRVKELLGEAGMTGWYGCPICQVTMAGEDLLQHIDEHRLEEITLLDAATVTLEACDPVLDGRYRLGAVIGFRTRVAIDLRTSDMVMVQQKAPQTYPPPDLRKVAELDHPGIVRILDIGKSYLVLEHVDGRPLSEVVRTDQPIQPHWSARVVADLCDALNYCHQRDVVHGDVSSRNVILTGTGEIKLLNFSIRSFMSPDPDAQSDVYSAGRVLYQLLAGDPPTADLKQLPSVPEALRTIVETARHPDPAQRYQSAAQLRDDLRRTP